MQKKDSKFRRDFSPMTYIKNGYKGYCCFENYWQSGKVYDTINQSIYTDWWLAQTTGKRRYPGSKNKTVLYSMFEDGVQRNYIESRKCIYVPLYYELVINTESIQICKNLLTHNKDLVIYDFDGPRKQNSDPECLLLTKDVLIDKINDSNFSFGHGYIIGSILLNIHFSEYTENI